MDPINTQPFMGDELVLDRFPEWSARCAYHTGYFGTKRPGFLVDILGRRLGSDLHSS